MTMPSFTRWIRPLFAIAAAIVLGACNTVSRAPDPIKDAPRADASTVIVSVTTNTDMVRGFNALIVQRVATATGQKADDQHSLNQIALGLSRDTSLFTGQLPEGEYEFAVMADGTTGRRIEFSAGGRGLIGRFKVVRGSTIDLGRLVLTPLNVNVIMGRSAKVTSNQAIIERFAPEYAPLFKNGAAGGWVRPRNPDDNIEAYALSRPVGFDRPTETEDGVMVGASRLGSVILRMPNGQWRLMRSPGLESLLDVMPVKTNDALLIAVGEFNTLLRAAPNGRELVPIHPGNLPPGNLVFIAGDEVHGWYVALQRKDDVTIHHSLFLENGDWQPVRKETTSGGFWGVQQAIWLWRRPDGFSYATSEGRLHHFDFTSGQWRSFTAPKERHIADLVPSPDGSIGVLVAGASGLAGAFAELYLTQDQGATWSEITPKNSIRVGPPMRLRSGTLLARSLVLLKDIELNASKDGGQTWLARKESTPGRLTALPSGRLVSIESGYLFNVKLSSDEGDTWQTGFSNYDVKAAQK